jgi:hypothetical protein
MVMSEPRQKSRQKSGRVEKLNAREGADGLNGLLESSCSSLRNRCTPPGRTWFVPRRQVSWLAGHRTNPAFPA